MKIIQNSNKNFLQILLELGSEVNNFLSEKIQEINVKIDKKWLI